jgi:hypothetical protein
MMASIDSLAMPGHAWPAQTTWPGPKTWPETYRCQQSHGGQPLSRWPALASAGQGDAPLPMPVGVQAMQRAQAYRKPPRS